MFTHVVNWVKLLYCVRAGYVLLLYCDVCTSATLVNTWVSLCVEVHRRYVVCYVFLGNDVLVQKGRLYAS
jgi:hypothetical protein